MITGQSRTQSSRPMVWQRKVCRVSPFLRVSFSCVCQLVGVHVWITKRLLVCVCSHTFVSVSVSVSVFETESVSVSVSMSVRVCVYIYT